MNKKNNVTKSKRQKYLGDRGFVVFIAFLSPLIFSLSLMPASLFGSIIGPARTNLMIEQLEGDTGAASSLMSCAFTFFGSIGMFVISLNFSNRILIMGLMYTIIGIVSLISWIFISRKPYIKHVAYHVEVVEQ